MNYKMEMYLGTFISDKYERSRKLYNEYFIFYLKFEWFIQGVWLINYENVKFSKVLSEISKGFLKNILFMMEHIYQDNLINLSNFLFLD